MKKRGISPLIAWVLLVGLAISTGLLITQWAIDEFSNVELPYDSENYCNNVNLKLEQICVNGTKVKFNLTNNGYFSIKRFTLDRATTNNTEAQCTWLNIDDLKPGDENIQFNYHAAAPNNQYDVLELVNCNGLSGGSSFNLMHNLTKFEITPWIEVDDQPMHCIEQGISLNNSIELNTIC